MAGDPGGAREVLRAAVALHRDRFSQAPLAAGLPATIAVAIALVEDDIESSAAFLAGINGNGLEIRAELCYILLREFGRRLAGADPVLVSAGSARARSWTVSDLFQAVEAFSARGHD
jgi:hypothetical protein